MSYPFARQVEGNLHILFYQHQDHYNARKIGKAEVRVSHHLIKGRRIPLHELRPGVTMYLIASFSSLTQEINNLEYLTKAQDLWTPTIDHANSS